MSTKFTSEKIERIIKSKGGEFLKKVYLFDVYYRCIRRFYTFKLNS